MPLPENKTNSRSAAPVATGKAQDPAGQFVAKFAKHHRKCMSLAKRFTLDHPELKQSAAIGQLCRASQEMLEQAKAAQTLTEIYLALDEKHRDIVRPIITARFKDIATLARTSWRRFHDSVALARSSNPEIESAQREFQPHADEFQEALQAFIAMSATTH